MTTLPGETLNKVYYDEPAIKKPPLLTSGALAWIRHNLFGSLLDTVLTLVGSFIVISVTTSLLTWSFTWANWFVIIFNLRQFLIGRFEPAAEWRIVALAALVAFVMGWALAVWSRVSRRTFLTLVAVVALTFILPLLISATVPLSPAVMAAGQRDVVYGTVTQTPLERVGFIAGAGEVVTVRMATEFSQSDAALTNAFSFTDNAANALRNAASSRLATEARIPQIERQLAGDALTANQRALLADELAALQVPPAVVESYTLNEAPVRVQILDGATLELIASALLTAGGEPLEVVIPADGWYVLEKTVDDPQSVALLFAYGIYPMTERSFTRPASTAPDGTLIPAGRVSQYLRMIDGFMVEGGRPRVDGDDLIFANIIENQYRGARPFHDYLSLFLGPFLRQIAPGLALLLLAGAVGYAGARGIDRALPRQDRRRRVSLRAVMWMLVALPLMAFVLIAGFGILPRTSPPLWGGLLLTMMLTVAGIVLAFPLGVALALGRRSSLPVIKTVCILYIELVRGVPLITVLVMGMLLVPLVAPWLGGPDTAPYRAMVAVILFSAAYLAENVRGGLQSLPPGQEEAAKAVGLSGWQTTLYITLPQALRAVIPALVGQFIALFKDTSLVAIVGLIDLTGIAQTVVAQTEFIGLRREVFVFISVIYFVFSYAMSVVSRRIEESGSGSARRI
jgi:His/Glu/Gln/Arg/opine family amino acid ABC transporter permease subunit